MYGWLVLLMLSAVAATGIAYGGIQDNAAVELVITTHNPLCTAAFLHHIDVARLTDVRPISGMGSHYGTNVQSFDELRNGINVSAIVWPHQMNGTVQAIVERSEVISVAAYPYMASNSTYTERQMPLVLAVNSDVGKSDPFGTAPYICDVTNSNYELGLIMDAIGWAGVSDPVPTPESASDVFEASESAPEPLTLDVCTQPYKDPETGIYYCGDLMDVVVWTYNITDTWRFLQENEALVLSTYGEDGSLSTISAAIPVSILWALLDMDGVSAVEITIDSFWDGYENYTHFVRLGGEVEITIDSFWDGYGDIKTEGWGVRDPATHQEQIIFGANDTTNQFRAKAGDEVQVWLRWYDADNSNTDLNLFVSNGTTHHTGVVDQWGGTSSISAEKVSFVPVSDDIWNISLAVIGTAVPDWIQLFAVGIDGSLEHHSESILDNTQIDLVITTHNPGCTTIFLLDYDVTRKTELRSTHLYSVQEMEDGLNMTFSANTTVAAKLVPLLADRVEISSVASYSTGPSPVLLAHDTNPDIDTDFFTGTAHLCDVLREPLLGAAVDALLADSAPAGTSDPSPYRSYILVQMATYKFAETLAYLKENGAVISSASEGRDGDEGGSIYASVPYTLLAPLYKMDHIKNLMEPVPPWTTNNYGRSDK